MRRLSLHFLIILVSLLCHQNSFAQKDSYDMIGKKISYAIKVFGKPAYHDKSNPDMECIFYRTKTNRLVFVGNKTGIYQSEKSDFFSNENQATKEISRTLSKCISRGFAVDSLAGQSYEVKLDNCKLEISLFENKVLKKFEVRVKSYK